MESILSRNKRTAGLILSIFSESNGGFPMIAFITKSSAAGKRGHPAIRLMLMRLLAIACDYSFIFVMGSDLNIYTETLQSL
jgi:hypothetical protein